VIEALGRLGADVNRAAKDGRTPVFMAAEKGHTAAIEALGKLGADVNRASDGADVNRAWTPLAIALDRGHAAAADALRRLGAAS
jgi:ankyrin repeat protein